VPTFKIGNDLTKAESHNATLSAQLANMQPQLSILESRVSALANQLSTESMRRVCAENKAEEAETRLRVSEGTMDALRSCGELRRLREENEELCERLAFLEDEAEDRRDGNNAERERHGEEVEGLRGDVHALTAKWMRTEEELESLRRADACNIIAAVEENGRGCGFDATPTPSADEKECIEALEDESSRTRAGSEEAPAVEAERRTRELSENGVANASPATFFGDVADSETTSNRLLEERIRELESSLKRMEEENASMHEETRRLRDEQQFSDSSCGNLGFLSLLFRSCVRPRTVRRGKTRATPPSVGREER
jgi:phage shock protein A